MYALAVRPIGGSEWTIYVGDFETCDYLLEDTRMNLPPEWSVFVQDAIGDELAEIAVIERRLGISDG